MKNKKLFLKVITTMLFVLLLLSFSATSFAGAVSTAPQFMANFPMLAGDNVMMMWVPVPGAVKYKLYLNGKAIGEAPAPPFTTTAPSDPGTYRYTISGVDPAGEEGPASPEGILSIIKLEQPKGFSFRFLGEVLNIRWDVVQDAVIYDVYKSEKKDGPFQLVTSTTETRYVDDKVVQSEQVGKTFYYKLVSKDRFNKSSPDTEVNSVEVIKIEDVKTVALKEITLKIRRSKLVTIAKTMGTEEIKSAYDSKFLNDKQTMMYADIMGSVLAGIDKKGDRVRTFGEKGPKPDQFDAPFMFTVDEDDNVYLTDANKPRFFAYDGKGSLIYSADAHLSNEKEVLDHWDLKTKFVRAMQAGVVAYGDKLYIVEKGAGVIHIFNKSDGAYIDYFKNKEKNEINYFPGPGKMILDKTNKKLYISCSIARTVVVCDIETGAILYEIGVSRSFIGAFLGVSGFGFDDNGDIMISDSAMNTVQVFSKDNGEYMYHVGDVKAIADKSSKEQRAAVKNLNYPCDTGIDSEGKLWIYVGSVKGFMIRQFTNDKIWDATVDKSEE